MVRARSLLRGICAAVVLMVMAVGAGGAAAATLKVNTTADDSPSGDGLCSLREAIEAVDSPGSASGDCAPAAFGTNTIVLSARTYRVPRGEVIVQPPAVNLTIAGAGGARTVIDASGSGDRVLEVRAGSSVTIRGITIRGGQAALGTPGAPATGTSAGGPGGPGADGGAILNAGTLTLLDDTVRDSEAGAGGPGGPLGSGASADGGSGGAGGRGGAIFNTGNLTLDGVTLVGNRAGVGGSGGGAFGQSEGGAGGRGGAGGAGGAIASTGGTVTIVASTIRGNNAGMGGAGGTPGAGGAAGAGGAGGDGGGVWSDAALSMTNDTVVSGTAGDGGGGGFGGGPGGNGGAGGGVVISGSDSLKLLNATIVANAAGGPGAGGPTGSGFPPPGTGAAGNPGVGGGVVGGGGGGGTVTLENTLLALNTGGNCGPDSILDGGHNLSFAGSGCPATVATGDPDLGVLQNNGGPTQTIALGAGSPAIDGAPAGGGCPATDQRGVRRPSGTRCDIGAYEVAPPAVRAVKTRASGRHAVKIIATVIPNAGGARVWVQFGRTRSYGQRSAVHKVGGVTPVAITIRLPGLRPGTRYHYRIRVSTIDGSAQSGDRTLRAKR